MVYSNEDCVELRRNGYWNDLDCHHKRTFLCNAQESGTGIHVY